MKFVIDTNIVLVSVSKHSKYYWVFERLLNNEYTLCVTTDILLEYEEIIGRYLGSEAASDFLETLNSLPNVEYYNKYYFWNLIKEDYDDNKFVDCAIASNSANIVTHDKHFRVLDSVNFPKMKVVDIESFKKITE